MPKAKCSCGALLRIPDGKDRFRCPQCDKLLKLPTKKRAKAKAKPAKMKPLAEISPIEFDPSIDDDGPTITEYHDDDSSDDFVAGAMLDDSDDEVPLAPPPIPRRGRTLARAEPIPHPDPDEQPEPEEPEHVGYAKARAVSRIQLGVVGFVLVLPLLPIAGPQGLDGWITNLRNLDKATTDSLVRLLLPIGGTLALLSATLPLGRLRGQLVASLGLASGALALAHYSVLGANGTLAAAFPLFEHAQPAALIGIGALGAAAAGLMVAAAQVRGRAPEGGPRAIGAIAALAFLWATGALVDAHRALAGASDRWGIDVFAVKDATVTYQVKSSQVEMMNTALPYLHGGALAALILCALTALIGTLSTSKWPARIGAWSGMLGLLVIPLFGGALAVTGYPPENYASGLQEMIQHFGLVWGPIVLWWLGTRDVLADGLFDPTE